MLAQGADLVLSARGSKIYVYSMAEGMQLKSTIKGNSQVSAAACALNDSFLLIGTVSGHLYYYNTIEKKELITLEECEEIAKIPLKITCIFILNDIVYVTSETGTIRIFSIQLVQRAANTSTTINTTLTEGSAEKDGWMEEIESIGESTADTLSMNISRTEGTHHVFKYMREIKHTTPITSTAVCGSNIYILDMRGRVIVFPSKVVYDNISDIYFRKYLFCIDECTVFAEVGRVFTSVYFAKSPIKYISSTIEGGFFFILTESELEVMKIEEMGGKRVYSQKLSKETEEIVVDSKRSLIYGMHNGKPTRIDLNYVWIDKPIEDLKIEGSTIKEVRREEEPDVEGDEYFDIPNVKAVKDMALPSVKYASGNVKLNLRKGAFDFSSDSDEHDSNANQHNSDIEDLFESDDGSPSAEMPEYGHSHLLETTADPAPVTSTRKHCVLNKICGPVSITNNQDRLAYWSAECSIRVSDRMDYKQIEVVTRASSVEVSILKETGDIMLAAASKFILVLYTGVYLKIYQSACGIFSEISLVHKIETKNRVERVVCGEEFFCIVSECGLLSNVSVYSKTLKELFCLVGAVKGIAASGEYLGIILEEGEGVSVRAFRYVNGTVRSISSAYFNRQSIDFCGISNTGVFVFEVSSLFYILGMSRIIGLSSTVAGVPISVVGENIAYLLENENGSITIYPEAVQYSRIVRECCLGKKTNIYAEIEQEMNDIPVSSVLSSELLRNGSTESDQTAVPRSEEDENTIFIKRAHKSVETTPRKPNTSYSDISKVEYPTMHTPTKKVKHSNPFARNNTTQSK
ncbi:hypothetical protein NEPAR04_1643 [Nematocida parisii]|nr:hypothetical protein NEPAR08_1694 [Nematocida parisii]KAI5129759.1 hypothetical protein NEPAR03_1794 [Nematocida parisii]KAI5142821.1 hypothetical protein NEPAR04_1643 [Nematocida parisii]